MSVKRIGRGVKAALLAVLVIVLCGCTTSKSLYLETDRNDRIRITLDTTDGHDMRYVDNLLRISYEGRDELEGVIVSGEGYEDFLDRLREDYSFRKESEPFSYEWCEQDGETVFLCPISPQRAGMILSSASPYESIRPVVEKLSFSTYE